MGARRRFDWSVAYLMYRDGNTPAELAAFFGVTVSAVKQALAREQVTPGEPGAIPPTKRPRPKG